MKLSKKVYQGISSINKYKLWRINQLRKLHNKLLDDLFSNPSNLESIQVHLDYIELELLELESNFCPL